MKKSIYLRLLVEKILFGSKWLLVPFYLILIIALVNYLKIDIKEVYHYLRNGDDSKVAATMFILELIDMAMIAGLVIMIVKGGYTSFVCKNHSDDGEKTSSGVLKVKLSTAIIGVSSIALLQTFMNVTTKDVTWDVINKLLLIHAAFLIGAPILALVDYLHVKSESIHHEDLCANINPDKKEKHFTKDACDENKEPDLLDGFDDLKEELKKDRN